MVAWRSHVRRAAAIGALLTGLATGKAHAYVRSTTSMGAPFHWNQTCVPITIYLNKFTTTPEASGMSPTDVIKSVTAAAHAWSPDSVICPGAVATNPSLEIVPTLAPADARAPAIGDDARNTIVFRTERWSISGEAHTTEYAFEALAVTTVTSRGDGHIVDVDMEVNGVTQTWMNLDPGVSLPSNHGLGIENVFDLQNALTHEFGHFIGLAHTCFVASMSNPLVDDSGQIRPKDDQGKDVPDCDSAPAAVMNSVMWPQTDGGSTNKRTLQPDDINAVCGIYPQGRAAPVCALDQAMPGCAVAPPQHARRRGDDAVISFAAAAILILSVSVRRRAHPTKRRDAKRTDVSG
jgi:hypothetical protein